MAFSEFQYPTVIPQLNLTWRSAVNQFANVPPLDPTPSVRELLTAFAPLATTVNTEKARSEWITALVLGDCWTRYGGQIGLYSGVDFQADPAARLTGFCAFLITRSPQQPDIQPPAVVVFEAKRNDITDGLGQCIAGMVGAQRFNARAGRTAETVYGCVTTGSLWKFLQLDGQTLTFDLTEYTLHDLPQLLGIFTHMIGPVPVAG